MVSDAYQQWQYLFAVFLPRPASCQLSTTILPRERDPYGPPEHNKQQANSF